MTDVSIVRRNAHYSVNSDIERDTASALRLMQQLLALEDITDRHHKEQLTIGLWKWTEAAGMAPHAKYNTRYVSQGVMEAQSPTRINHEHVWTRRGLIEQLRAKSWSEDELRGFLMTYGVACIVTVEEHALLSAAEGEGWQRYERAGIAVFDRQEQTWLDLSGVRPVRTEKPPTERAIGLMASDELSRLIGRQASPEVATLLTAFNHAVESHDAVAVPSHTREGEASAYYRIYDAQIEEPTPAVAYAHWTGRIDFRLTEDDLPEEMRGDARISVLARAPYAMGCKVKDHETEELAEQLLSLALEKLRTDDDQ